MKNPYLDAISFFGIIIPLILFGIIFFGIKKTQSYFSTKHDEQAAAFQQDQLTIKQVEKLKNSEKEQNQILKEYESLLESEPSTAITQSLRQSAEKYGKELSQSSFSRSRSNSVATRVDNPSSTWMFTLKGSLRSIQKALVELEQTNPHLMADSISFQVDRKNQRIQTNAVYTAWQK